MLFSLLLFVVEAVADLSGGGGQSFAGSTMVQRLAAPAIALERSAFGDVKEVQDNLMKMEDHLNGDVKDFEQRMKTGNFPQMPAMPSSFLQSDEPDKKRNDEIPSIDPKLERIAQELEAFNTHLKKEADSYVVQATEADHKRPQPSSLHDADHLQQSFLETVSMSGQQGGRRVTSADQKSYHISPLQSSLHDAEDPHSQTTGIDVAKALVDLHAKLKAETTKLHVQAKKWMPSSLLESTAPQLSPDDYAKMALRELGVKGNIDEKLKDLEKRANHFLEKAVESEKVVPSSFLDQGAPHQRHLLRAFEDNLEKKGKLAEKRTHEAMEALMARTHELDKTTKQDEEEAHRIEAEMKKEADSADSSLKVDRSSLLETSPDSLEKQIQDMTDGTEESVDKHGNVGLSSFLQDDPSDTEDLEKEDSQMQELLADIQHTDKQFVTSPGSLIEEGFPLSEAQKQLDAAGPRLKELDQHFKHEIGQYADELQQDADSSLLQTGHRGVATPSAFMQEGENLMQERAEDSRGEQLKAPELFQPSLLQAAAIDSTGSINLRKG
jgi:hypothetical protein